MFRHRRKWARRCGVTCFRVYDHDIPDQPVVVDWYDGRALVYAMYRKRDETPEAREAWLDGVVREVTEALEIEPDVLYLKERRPQRQLHQYRRLGDQYHEFVVAEHGLRFLVNLSDYHDTGLFLDHRQTRALVRDAAAGLRVLNLFAYTGSFSVYAAAGGAAETVSVDISNTYLAWADRNLRLNGLSERTNRLVRADVLLWLPRAAAAGELWDLIICDPPTFSNSRKMRGALDLQAHHPRLLADCLAVLHPGGTLLFSTNDRGFRLREDALAGCAIEEITEQTLPPDFRNSRGTRIHQCWRIRHLHAGSSNHPPARHSTAAPTSP